MKRNALSFKGTVRHWHLFPLIWEFVGNRVGPIHRPNNNNDNSYNIYRALSTDVSKRYNQIDKTDGF